MGGLNLGPAMPRPAGEVLRIAHRSLDGAADPAAVCRQLAADGAQLVEVDVRISADDEVLVWHDPWAGGDGQRRWLADLPAERVPRGIGRLAPTLEAVADAGLGAYLDIKSLTPVAAGRLLTAVKEAGLSDRCVLASSHGDIVAGLAELSRLPRSVLFGPVDEDPVQLAASVGAAFAHPCWERLPAPHRELSADWLQRLIARGIGVICWHEERPDVLRALLGLGVDGICTDDMPLLRELAR